MTKTTALLSPRCLALAAAILLSGSRLIFLYVVPSWQTIVTDFPNYYVSAWAVRHGESLTELYNPLWFESTKRRAGIERPAALFNYFPPMNAMIMWPLANLAPITAKRAWTIVNILALLVVIDLTAKSSGLRWPAAALMALLAGDALGNNFSYGQFYIVLTLLMLSAVLSSERWPWIAGAASAAGTLTKIFPGFLLVYFVIRRPDGFGGPPQMEEKVSTSPNGKWTAFATGERGNWDIAIRSNETGEIRLLTSSSANDLTPSFSPDGRSVYFASDRHRGYRFTTIYRISIDDR